MEKNMQSEYSNNPLTEVALALSMAFFSIMVLSIFALSQTDTKLKSTNSLKINSSSSQKNDQKNKREIIFYFKKGFYNKNFKKWNLDNIPKSDTGYFLAVPSEISVKELFEIKSLFKNTDVKITQKNKEWADAFNNKFRKRNK
jgi:hypothetical protein